MNLAATQLSRPLDFSLPTPSSTSGAAPGVAADRLAGQQARFRIEGTGPLTSRSIAPASAGAAALVARSPGAFDAVRGVLQLVEHVAGGPGASSKVDLNGVAFSTSQAGLGANTWRAQVDDNPKLRSTLASMSAPRRQELLTALARHKHAETADMLANVDSGWINLGPVASSALLHTSGATAATPVTRPQLAQTVRTLLHESVHAVDTEPANLPAPAMHGVWESLAEARTMSLPQLQAARRALGLDERVPDADLAQTLRHRPYARAEQVLAGVMKTAGIAPASPIGQQVLRSSGRDAVDTLVTALATHTGSSTTDARTAIAGAFAETMPAAR